MIIVQTPLRVSLFGGGTDFPGYYLEEGGCVLSTAIDKYIFVTIKKRFDEKLRVGYTRTEMVDTVDEIQHELIREAFRKAGLRSGVEITTMGDIPSEGSGLGSSSTVTVGTLHAMYALQGRLVSAEQLAAEACEIEIDILGKPIGVQDQYIAAYGGFQFIEFTREGKIVPNRIGLSIEMKRTLDSNLMLFYTGLTRRAEVVLGEQKQNIGDRLAILREIKNIAQAACRQVTAGCLDSVGELLHESWLLKKQLARQISNGDLDNLYEKARKAGAIGGKIAGAGGGGFLLLYCPHERQESVRRALGNLQELHFRMEDDGTKVIFHYRRD